MGDLGWEDPLEKGMATHSIFLHGEFHGQRSLAGFSPGGCKESDMTEGLTHTHTHMCQELGHKDERAHSPARMYIKHTLCNVM